MSTYSEPVSRLLSYGVLSPTNTTDRWPDHTKLGIGTQDIPELIRMANDTSLMEDEASDEEYSAPAYAAYILGELHATEAIEPLLPLFDIATEKDHEWLSEELPHIYGKIGPMAIPALTSLLADSSHSQYASAYMSNALVAIARKYPEDHARSIAGIIQRLERFAENDAELNAFLITDLAQIQEKEALPLIEKAFAAKDVDESIVDMNEVLVGMGLKEPDKEAEMELQNLLDRFGFLFNKSQTSDTDDSSDSDDSSTVDASPTIDAVSTTETYRPIDAASTSDAYSRPVETYSSPNAAYWHISQPSDKSSKNKHKSREKMAKASRKKTKRSDSATESSYAIAVRTRLIGREKLPMATSGSSRWSVSIRVAIPNALPMLLRSGIRGSNTSGSMLRLRS